MSQNDLQRPYLMADWPRSDGRTFLAHAFAFFMALEWGHGVEEIDAALDLASECDPVVRIRVLGAVKNLGAVVQQGRIETSARPFGGGVPRLLPRSAWELDDFAWRFGTCAIHPEKPFDRSVDVTHWIFVDTDHFDDVIGLARGTTRLNAQIDIPVAPDANVIEPAMGDRFLRKAEVLKLVPFSRSTLDDRVRRGLFPRSQDLGGGIVVWLESDVRLWMQEQRSDLSRL